MSEKRLASSGDSFVDLTQMETVDLLNKLSDENTKLHKKVDEQQATIKELEKNFDDLVNWASQIAKRNVQLDEQIGKIQQGIRIAYEKKPYPTIEDIQKEIKQ